MTTGRTSAKQAGAKAPADARRKRVNKARTRVGSWSMFVRRFKPLLKRDDGGFVDTDRLPQGIDQHLVWTLVDDCGHWYVIPGQRWVNRIAYVICAIPWSDADWDLPGYLYG